MQEPRVMLPDHRGSLQSRWPRTQDHASAGDERGVP